jgi:DNA-binding NarL/FixJ family response regulator
MRGARSDGILSGVGRTCLIVDDSQDFLGAARDLLERQGMTIVGLAGTSAEALAMTADLRPELVLVDVDLGPESGLDLARALAERDDPAPVIMISAYPEKDLRELLEDAPAAGFLPKSALSRDAIDGLLAGA